MDEGGKGNKARWWDGNNLRGGKVMMVAGKRAH